MTHREVAPATEGARPAPARAAVLRRCACGGGALGECADCRKKRLHMKRAPGGSTSHQYAQPSAARPDVAPPIVEAVLTSAGTALPRSLRTGLEPRFGHDFAHVRVHTDTRAAESAQAVGALAYTVSPHIVFGAGQYAPDRTAGHRLLAHELAHVVQQDTGRDGGATAAAGIAIGPTTDPLETQADALAAAATDPATATTTRAPRATEVST